MLQLLVRHARSIVIGILLFIVAIAGYWIYSWQAGKQSAAAARELGAILIVSDTKPRIANLETYLASAPQSMKGTAWFAIMEGARQLQDYPKVYEAWKAIGALEPGLKVPSGLGMSSALAAQSKSKEAVAALDGIAAGLNPADSLLVTSQIAAYAELAGDYNSAIAACDTLSKLPEAAAEAGVWAQKKAELERKKAEAAKSQ